MNPCPASAQKQEDSPPPGTNITMQVSPWFSGQASSRGLFISGVIFWPIGICVLHLNSSRPIESQGAHSS